MKVELPSGNWVELRDNLKGRDRTAVNAVLRIRVRTGEQQEREQEVGADVSDRMHDTLLANLITLWSFERPIPSSQGGADAVADLDIDDYHELHSRTEDLLQRVTAKSPN